MPKAQAPGRCSSSSYSNAYRTPREPPRHHVGEYMVGTLSCAGNDAVRTPNLDRLWPGAGYASSTPAPRRLCPCRRAARSRRVCGWTGSAAGRAPSRTTARRRDGGSPCANAACRSRRSASRIFVRATTTTAFRTAKARVVPRSGRGQPARVRRPAGADRASWRRTRPAREDASVRRCRPNRRDGVSRDAGTAGALVSGLHVWQSCLRPPPRRRAPRRAGVHHLSPP